MRHSLLLSMAVALCNVSLAHIGSAQAESVVVSGPMTASPWQVVKVSRLNVFRPGPAAAADAGEQKFLHIQVQFNNSGVAQKKDKFRVVDERGNEVGELSGWNDDQHLVIFEGHWTSLNGLYLDGAGHREPLFTQVAATPRMVTHRAVVTTPALSLVTLSLVTLSLVTLSPASRRPGLSTPRHLVKSM